jgi:Rrf2 family protein
MFSKATEYALRATIYIAQNSSEEKKLGIVEIAEAIGSPRSFTAKILQFLTKENKVLCSVSGPNGGFYITDDAKKLSVRTILAAMGEDEILDKCIVGLPKCSDTEPCAMHAQYKVIKSQLIQVFNNTTIGAFADQLNRSK